MIQLTLTPNSGDLNDIGTWLGLGDLQLLVAMDHFMVAPLDMCTQIPWPFQVLL
jgi:hypothetical protein